MVIQFILSIGLLLSLVYALTQGASTRLLRVFMTAVVVSGIYLVWFPDQTIVIANFLGVGRGADLIAYLWIVVGILLILILHLRTMRLKAAITELTRHIALREAEQPHPDHVRESE